MENFNLCFILVLYFCSVKRINFILSKNLIEEKGRNRELNRIMKFKILFGKKSSLKWVYSVIVL